jgi:hypothetical protein
MTHPAAKAQFLVLILAFSLCNQTRLITYGTCGGSKARIACTDSVTASDHTGHHKTHQSY